MLNYMRAECYKLLHRKYMFLFSLVILACEALLNAGFVFTNVNGNYVDFYTGGVMATAFLTMGLYLAIVVADAVFSDQYKYNTLKNEVSFGIPRTRIYLGKLLVTAMAGLVMAAIFLAFYEVLCFLTLPAGEAGSTRLTLTIVGYCALAALPQWLGAVAVTNMFFFLLRSNAGAAFAALAVICLPEFVLARLSAFTFFSSGAYVVFQTLGSWMPGSMISGAAEQVGSWAYMGQSWLIGLVWVAVFTAAGLAVLRKKEIT